MKGREVRKERGEYLEPGGERKEGGVYILFCEIFPQSLHPLPPQVMFKLGDDLRQDQLILQLIMLMDRLLRRENLDLKLTPYNVLACSGNHGIILTLPTSPIPSLIPSLIPRPPVSFPVP